MKKALLSWVSKVAFAGLISVACTLPGAAQDKNNQPSDRTVDFLKTFVEGFLIPDELPRKDGTKLKVNRSDEAEMKKFAIPREDMRRIILIAYNGATAEICNRDDLQAAAYSYMKGEEFKKKKWSEYQLFFISRLYLATVMWQTGSATLVEDEPKKGTEKAGTGTAAVKPPKEVVCTDARRETVKKLETFLKSVAKS